MGPQRISPELAQKLQKERQAFRAQVASALNEEDDPLAAYYQFVQWTVKNYGEKNPDSGLVVLLEEATKEFKDDPLYKTDLRYFKLWSLYARQVERSSAIAIYAHLMENSIGTSYSVLYEEYATLLESDGRRQEAEAVYRNGIKRQVRPLERLKTRFRDFQSRTSSTIPAQSSSSAPAKPSSQAADNARRNLPTSTSNKNRSISASSSASSAMSQVSSTSRKFTPESRYAPMLAPPDPGKLAEKQMFNLSLLFTDESVEYSIQEARARSLGLLGKKWGPPPASEMPGFAKPLSTSAPVDFNDDSPYSARTMGLGGRRKSLMVGGGAEPTVTINTKEALADVFGMYNSPEKTMRTMAMPGSKHAPLRKIDALSSILPVRQGNPQANENSAQNAKTPTPAFRPFIDENAQSSRTPAGKFTPFVDPESNKTPFITPRPVLSLKEPAITPASNIRTNENPPKSAINVLKAKGKTADRNDNVFSKVFTPAQAKPVPLAPLRDVFTDDHGKPQAKAKQTHERAKSQHDALPAAQNEGLRPAAFTPFVDENARTPFKVFTRPPEQDDNENAYALKTPGGTFTPFVDTKPAFTPFRDAHVAFKPFTDKEEDSPDEEVESGNNALGDIHEPAIHTPTWSNTDSESTEEDLESGPYEEEYQNGSLEQYETPSPADESQEEFEEGGSYQDVPLGGRFGQFNVMTPITERTVEYTSTRSAFGGTPSMYRNNEEDADLPRGSVFIPQQTDEYDAVQAAERLAAELREEYSDEDEGEKRGLSPLRYPDEQVPNRDDSGLSEIEEKTGTLSLVDTLTINSKFKPPNPCNPFDPPIMTTLLTCIPTDPYYHDLRSQESKTLDSLLRFTKKARKTSGNTTSTGVLDVSSCFALSLEGHRFSVSEKLGEGGFGSVFKARDLGMRQGSDDDDDDDDDETDDEEGASMVALKIVKPRNVWEYHVLRRIHSALPPSLRRSVVLPHALFAFRDESFLILDLCPQGTLLNIVNGATAAGVSQQGACLDELLVMFFSIELLRLLEAMHKIGFIHGDLKIDNCLLRLEDVPGGASAWSSLYQPSGDGGWSCKGLKIIDFGRTIDTRLFPSGQEFIAEWATDERDCPEIREDRPWTFQTDYFGLAGIIYCMLFGKYIQESSVSVMKASDGEVRRKISTPLKRYWQTELWNKLFDVLLNPSLVKPDGKLPLCEELGVLRGDMETWLQANCNRTSNTLKGLLKKVELSCFVR